MKYHPIAEVFPLMDPDEFADLIATMKRDGFDSQHPVVVYNGLILDGRHRWQAAKQAGMDPKTVEFEGDEEAALRFAIRENATRRHLTTGQRAAVALELEPFFARLAKAKMSALGKEKPRSEVTGRIVASLPQSGPRPIRPTIKARNEAAQITGASPRNVQNVKAIRKADPAKFDAVKNGTLTVNAARKLIPPPPERPDRHPALAHAKDFKEQVNALHAVIRWCKVTNANVIYGREITSARLNGIVRDLENVITAIKFATPFAVCPCAGKEAECRLCHADGWITEAQQNRIPPSKK